MTTTRRTSVTEQSESAVEQPAGESAVEQPAGESAVEQSAGEPAARSQDAERIRALDFSQPTKFTTELRRRIARSLDGFSASLYTVLAGVTKADVEVSLGDVSQYTWAAAKARLPADSVAVAVEARAIERRMLMSVELPLMLQTIECLLGGEAAHAPAERHLTDVDWVLAKGVLDSIVAQLSVAWEDLGAPALTRGEVDIEGDAGVLPAAGEPTLSVVFDTRIDALRSTVSLLIPWDSIEPITESIRGGYGAPAADPRGREALRRSVAGANVLLRAEIGSVQMPIEHMLELAPGALVQLQERADDGVLLFAEGVSIARGHPGRSGLRRALKLVATGEPAVRADTYAKLGRNELERARAHLHSTRENPESRAILRSIFVRVWAELGRTHMPLGRSLELAQGAVVELDQAAEAPVELFANGLCFANGRLVVTTEGAWGIEVDALVRE
jgi:flagellar motor switch protein FliM